MLIATVVGARPQFIKASAVSRRLRSCKSVTEQVINTGQHYDFELSRIFFQELEMSFPDFDLGIGSGPHGEQTGQMLKGLEGVLLDLKPDWVLVYGDTNSTLAGALAAAKLHIPIAHVEAGLRSFNRTMPEEVNRVITDHISNLLFAPTDAAVANLRHEGIGRSQVAQVGDVMFDVALAASERAERTSRIIEELGLERGSFILATIHRADTTDDPTRLSGIMDALDEVASDHTVVMPLHPRTSAALKSLRVPPAKVKFVDALGYLDMMMLEKHAALIVTDSGGVQKEAFFHGVQCVTVRDDTEWVELLELGWNSLVSPGEEPGSIRDAILKGVDRGPGHRATPYGKGRAAEAIIHHLTELPVPPVGLPYE
jgi:UDP-GlcNAc3NAcA epimerase